MLIATTAKVLSGIPKMGGDRRGGGGRRWRRWWINRGCVKDKRGRKWERERQREEHCLHVRMQYSEGGRINNAVYSLHVVSCPGHTGRMWLESEAKHNWDYLSNPSPSRGVARDSLDGFHSLVLTYELNKVLKSHLKLQCTLHSTQL